MKAIEISYFWGDKECKPVEIPEGKDPLDIMMELALNEMKIECTEHNDEGVASIEPSEDEIKLFYMDGEVCYYKLIDYTPEEK